MNKIPRLPPGQREIDTLPRFGLSKFARRFPAETEKIALEIGGDVVQPIRLSAELENLERVDQISDFHCVTTWSALGVRWSGYRFTDFYATFLERTKLDAGANFVVFRCQDGYRVSLLLEDLMAADVILADRLEGQPLPIAHGAPLRLIAPAHYGYKSAKHINKIEFWRDDRNYRFPAFAFMDHPRARVVNEERGRVIPGVLLRWLYRPQVESTIRRFRTALSDHLDDAQQN